MAILRSEFRKLLTVRSTYVMFIVAILIVGLLAFWVEGYKGIGGSPASMLTDKALETIFKSSAMVAATFGGIMAVLYAVHEYRYNMIVYTFTAANSRTKVLLAKFITMVMYAVIFSFICGAIGIGLYYLGLHFRDASLPAQNIDWLNATGKVLFYNIAQILIALMIGIVTRSIAAGIAIIFLIPITIEPLLGLVLKQKAAYLPFAALERVAYGEGAGMVEVVPGELSVTRAIVVSTIYLVSAAAITWLLYLKRDAN